MENYLSFSNQDLENCEHIKERNLICTENSPAMNTKIMNNCEINFLRNVDNSQNCNIRIGNFTNEIWIRLRQQNTWLFVIPVEQKTFIKYKNYFETISLYGTGIIRLKSDCQIKTINVMISTHATIETTKTKIIFPNIDLGEKVNKMLEPLNLKNNSVRANIEPRVMAHGQSNRLSEISESIEKLQKMEHDNLMREKFHGTSKHVGLLQIIIWIILSVISIMIIKSCIEIICKLSKCKKRKLTINNEELIKVVSMDDKTESSDKKDVSQIEVLLHPNNKK